MFSNLVRNESSLLYLAGFLILAIIILALWIWRLDKRMRNIFGGKSASDIETSALDNQQRLKKSEDFQEKALKELQDMERRIKRSIQAVETIRFNPFKGTGAGGNQSFSSAFLNEKGDGVVLTGLYSRERVSVYAKPLKELRGEFELSEEEKEAIGKARDFLNKKD
jgi:hypothetical protein